MSKPKYVVRSGSGQHRIVDRVTNLPVKMGLLNRTKARKLAKAMNTVAIMRAPVNPRFVLFYSNGRRRWTVKDLTYRDGLRRFNTELAARDYAARRNKGETAGEIIN